MVCIHDIAFRKCKICLSTYTKNYNKIYREKHKEVLKRRARLYYLNNIEKHKQQGRQWRKVNREKLKIVKRTAYISNRSKFLEHQKERHQALKRQVMSHYSRGGPKCASCGFQNINALSIDHIEGGGNRHRKEVVGGQYFYLWLSKNDYPSGFQVLCYNCNWLKRLVQQVPIKVKNERKNRTTKAYFLRNKTLVFQYYSKNIVPYCNSCSNDNFKVLSVDHLNGHGSDERRKVGYGSTFYLWLVKNNFPPGYQILCLNCQMIKRAENGESRRLTPTLMQPSESVLSTSLNV